jgi:hypothetical protein
MGFGSGPVYMFHAQFIRSDPEHLNKVVWAADPSYTGPIRVRGGRIDGGGQVLLESFDNRWGGSPLKTVDKTRLYSELDLLVSHSTFPSQPSGWRMWPTLAYVATPGCYGVQIDGIGFTELFTFHSLDLASLAAGAPCPTSPLQVAHNLSSEFGYGPALGVGPIYPLMGEMQGGVLRYSQPQSSAWAFSKVMWIANPVVTGSVLIRGRQIDGAIDAPNSIGFGMHEPPELVLQWDIAPRPGWASLPSEIRLRAPGCYAFQFDSQLASGVIVFQVV